MSLPLSYSVLSGFGWTVASRVLGGLGQLSVYIVLARLLEPRDFGVIAALSVVLNVFNMMSTSGLAASNIQIKDRDSQVYPTIFYIGIFLSFACYAILFLSASFISDFFSFDIDFEFLLKIYALSILLTVVNSLQISELSRRFLFKKIFFITTLSSFVSGVLSCWFAYLGWGVYALMLNLALNRFISFLLCFYFGAGIPAFNFSIRISCQVLKFGWSIFLYNLLEELYRSSITLIFARLYNATLLGYFNVGRQIPSFFSSTVNSTIASVLFPLFSKFQDDPAMGKYILRNSLRSFNFIIFPFIAFVYFSADNIVYLVLGKQWLPSVFYFKITFLALGLVHVNNTTTHFINSLGKSDVSFRFLVISRFVGMFFIISSTFLDLGPEYVVVSFLIAQIVAVIINIFPCRYYINYFFGEQALDIFWPIIISFLIYFIVLFVNQLFLDPLLSAIFSLDSFLDVFCLISIHFMVFFICLYFFDIVFRLRIIDFISSLRKVCS